MTHYLTETESINAFDESYYRAKFQPMKLKVGENDYNTALIVKYSGTLRRLKTLIAAFEYQNTLHPSRQFIMPLKSWYIREIEKCKKKLNRILILYKS